MGWRDYASAPDPGTPVCERAAVRGVATLLVDTARGRFPLLLVEAGGAVRAFVNACPHQYLPLDHRGPQVLSADGRRLLCTMHGAVFDAATGEGVAGPGLGCALDAVPLREAGDLVVIGEG